MRTFRRVTKTAVEGDNFLKFTQPNVSVGETAFPCPDEARLGVRYNYDGKVSKDGIECHKYDIQPEVGDDIPYAFWKWKINKGGTHAIMASVYVKENGTREDVEKALDWAHKSVGSPF